MLSQIENDTYCLSFWHPPPTYKTVLAPISRPIKVECRHWDHSREAVYTTTKSKWNAKTAHEESAIFFLSDSNVASNYRHVSTSGLRQSAYSSTRLASISRCSLKKKKNFFFLFLLRNALGDSRTSVFWHLWYLVHQNTLMLRVWYNTQ